MKTAVVLGSGGVTAIAWELGLLAGLAAEGADLTKADLVVGTSAGAVTGANLASGADMRQLYESALQPVAVAPRRMSVGAKLRYGWAACSTRSPSVARTRLGKLALATGPVPEPERRATFRARLTSTQWPARRLLITAVDVESGDMMAFSSTSGVDLTDAVIASCALPGVWPPATILGRLWMDGATRSATNADLGGDCERVIIIAPVSRGLGAIPGAAGFAGSLRSRGHAVALISPGPAALAAIGQNALYGSRSARRSAARAGYAQAKSAAMTIDALLS